jgi:PAS domain S-box-containing protein
MQVPPTPTDESRRLAALAEFQLLDTPAEENFDTFTRLAAAVCRTPIALLSLTDRDREWYKSNVGLDGVSETKRAFAFCSPDMKRGEVFEVADARADVRYAKHPLVAGDPYVRFYAAAPLVTANGMLLGTICVIDREPRTLAPEQRTALLAIAAAIMHQFEARRTLIREQTVLQERIQLLTAAMEGTEDAVIISRPGATAHDDDTLVYVNDAFLRAKGATAEEVIGMTSGQFFGPRTDMAVVTAMREKLLAGEPARAEWVTYRLDGSHYYAGVAARPLTNERGETAYFVVNQHDVTESVLRGAQLTMQNKRLTELTAIARGIFAALEPHALVDALLAGVRELIGADARLLVALPGGGYVPTPDLTVPDDVPKSTDPFVERAGRSDVTTVSDDDRRAGVRIPGSLGQTRYVLDARSTRKLHTADIFALGLLGQYFAVAARNVELYGELQTRRAAVVELNQVKNDLIAMLAHDFKGPLTTIVGFADVLAEDERFDDESRKFLNMISSSAMRLASLATDTLALSRLEQNELALNVEEFDLVALVGDIARVFSVTREIDFSSDRPEFITSGDESRLRQVFENLIGNAIKYSPGGQPVTVRVAGKGRGAEVSVSDRGIGIPETDKAKLFGRFARAGNARTMGIGGTGFGLYLSKRITEMHGGTITVDSREGDGSTFRVQLPGSLIASRPLHRRFLLLDADGEAKSYVAHALRDDGFAATVVANGKALLEAIDETQFDAALVETEKVGMALDEFVRRVAGRTALVRIDTATVAETPGWDAYLVKPFLIKDLRAAIDAALALHPRPKPAPVMYSAAVGSI